MKNLSDLLSKEYLGVVLCSKGMIHVFRNGRPICSTRLTPNPTFIRPPQEVTEVTCGWVCQSCINVLWAEQKE